MRLNKLCIGMSLALGLGMVTQAQAAAFYTDTVANWGSASPVLDGDGDSTWALNSYDTALGPATVTLSEDEIGGVDYYSANFDFTTMAGGGINNASYSLSYTATSTDELFYYAHLDSTHIAAGTSVTKTIFDAAGSQLCTLNSTDGAPDQCSFTPTSSITVNEVYAASVNGELHSSLNSISAVPEPATWGLMGVGLVGLLGLMKRRSA